nr:extensin-like [Aegilops tauschii subsp. strangulata]
MALWQPSRTFPSFSPVDKSILQTLTLSGPSSFSPPPSTLLQIQPRLTQWSPCYCTALLATLLLRYRGPRPSLLPSPRVDRARALCPRPRFPLLPCLSCRPPLSRPPRPSYSRAPHTPPHSPASPSLHAAAPHCYGSCHRTRTHRSPPLPCSCAKPLLVDALPLAVACSARYWRRCSTAAPRPCALATLTAAPPCPCSPLPAWRLLAPASRSTRLATAGPHARHHPPPRARVRRPRPPATNHLAAAAPAGRVRRPRPWHRWRTRLQPR